MKLTFLDNFKLEIKKILNRPKYPIGTEVIYQGRIVRITSQYFSDTPILSWYYVFDGQEAVGYSEGLVEFYLTHNRLNPSHELREP